MNLIVIDLARLDHENIAKFLGYCRESNPFSRYLISLVTSFRWGSDSILLAERNENSHRHRPRFKVSTHRVATSFCYIRGEIQFSIRYRRFYPQEIIVMRRLTTLSTEDPPATRWESVDQYLGVGTRIHVASLHKAVVNASKQG
ncbi:hypothetical protein ZWY2020_040736 [Hordeum vulgare]|nr:hypothetical protein ZWY2020_040736 [Hordeum vulgare]